MKDYQEKYYYQKLDDICQFLSAKQYRKAEFQLISLIKEIISHLSLKDGEINQLKKVHYLLYYSFNTYYLDWERRNNKNNKNRNGVRNYCNYLLSKCSLTPEIDDLLYELGKYLNTHTTKEQKKEVIYHLKCYKNSFSA